MDVWSQSDISSPIGAWRWQTAVQPLVQPMARLHKVRQLFEQCRHLSGREFVGQLLRCLDIRLEYDAAELRRLPATGAFVAVANHPCGILDGLILLYLLSEVRPDLRVVANELLTPFLQQLEQQLVLVSPERQAAGRNAPGVRRLLRFLHNDVPLLLFPAGQVAHRRSVFGPVTEPEWHPTAGRLLATARVPVVPVWLSGRNSLAFDWLGLVHPLLRTLRLPAELLNKRGQTIQVRIGAPIAPARLTQLPPAEQLGYLRARVFALAPEQPTALEKALAQFPTLEPPAVIAETAPELLAADIAALPARCHLLTTQHWEVYIARHKQLPHVLREIGRLREITFRREGEGTQQETDLDKYDEYYRHLFLYDRQAGRLVGAYRVGRGRAILRQHGRRGLYLHSLFHLNKALKPLLAQSLELGRSFIRPEYQKQALPLALLWKGIALYLDQHPSYRYLIGPVSISNRFSPAAKSVMIDYLKRTNFDADLARYVRPRKQFHYRPLDAQEAPSILQAGLQDLQGLHKLIGDMEPGGAGVPVLLRQYLKQNARLIGFNIDPRFSNALDGLIVLDAAELPSRTLRLLNRYHTA